MRISADHLLSNCVAFVCAECNAALIDATTRSVSVMLSTIFTCILMLSTMHNTDCFEDERHCAEYQYGELCLGMLRVIASSVAASF